MKCALAHILPDGRVLNPRQVSKTQNPYQGQAQIQQQQLQQIQQSQQQINSGSLKMNDIYSPIPMHDSSMNSSLGTSSSGQTTSATIRNLYMSAASLYSGTPEYSQSLTSGSNIPIHQQQQFDNINGLSSSYPMNQDIPSIQQRAPDDLLLAQQMTSSSSVNNSNTPSTANEYIHASQPRLVAPHPQHSSVNSHSSFLAQSMLGSQQSQHQRSFSTSFANSVGNGSPMTSSPSIWNKRPTANSMSSSMRPSAMTMLMSSLSSTSISSNSQSTLPLNGGDCAIDDGDEDDLGNDVNNDDGLEDFVPSSLTDLLTEQERKRRGSRPSSSTVPPTLNQSLHQPSPLSKSVSTGLNNSKAGTDAQSSTNHKYSDDVWSSSPKVVGNNHWKSSVDESFNPEVSYGSPFRNSTSSYVSSSAINTHNSSVYNPAPIGTPERSSYMSSRIGPNQNNSSFTNTIVGSNNNSSVLEKTNSEFNTGDHNKTSDSLFDDDLNGTPPLMAADSEFETQFAMDEEEEVVSSKTDEGSRKK